MKRSLISAIDTEIRYYKLAALIESTAYGKQFLRLADILNVKAQSLLSHISIMFASTSIIFASVNRATTSEWVLSILFFEVLGYIVLALMCLMATNITRPGSFGSLIVEFDNLPEDKCRRQAEEILIKIVIRRRALFFIAYFGTIGLTFILAFALLFEFVLKGSI